MLVQAAGAGLRPYTRVLEPDEKLGNMKPLLASERIRSYVQEGDRVTVYSKNPDILDELPIEENKGFEWRARLTRFVKPDHLARDCAPEYSEFRFWNLAASAIGGILGFMASQVYLDAQNASYASSKAIVLSGVLTGGIGSLTQMAASPLAKSGDADPRRSYLRGQFLNTATSMAGLGVLGALPGGHLPVFATMAITGAVGNTLASAANQNIFNHLVPGPSKGEVAGKNSNQELLAGVLSMPLGLALGSVAQALGIPAGVFGACLLGPMKAFCHLQAARVLRMSAVSGSQLGELAQDFLETGSFREANKESLISSLKLAFSPNYKQPTPLDFSADFRGAVGSDPEFTLDEFAGERYLLSIDSSGKVVIGLSRSAKNEDLLKSSLHASLIIKALGSGLPAALRSLGRTHPNRDLVRLTHRALPTNLLPLLQARGWHLSLDNLKIPSVEAHWSSAEPPDESVELSRLRNLLVERPDSGQLQSLLQLIAISENACEKAS